MEGGATVLSDPFQSDETAENSTETQQLDHTPRSA